MVDCETSADAVAAPGTTPVVVFCIGNPSRGDDALGPHIHGQLGNWLKTAGLDASVELIEDFQLQIEHALDLAGRQLAIFVDAGVGIPAPVVFRPLVASTVASHSTHALPPESVLQVALQMGVPLPPAYVLCVRGESFALGESLSPAARSSAAAALGLLQDLLGAAEGGQGVADRAARLAGSGDPGV